MVSSRNDGRDDTEESSPWNPATSKPDVTVGRRTLLRAGAATAMTQGLVTAGFARTARAAETRRVRITRRATGETFDAAYWTGGYNEGVLRRFSTFTRDARTDERITMDPLLLDYLYALKIETENDGFELFSGYRSESSNRRLRKRNPAVAEHSFHILGKALDIRLPGTHLARLYAAALDLGFGGIGYYPKSNFIHIDTGYWRRW